MTEEGATALHYAGQIAKTEVPSDRPLEDKEVIKLLIDGGANMDLVTKQVNISKLKIDFVHKLSFLFSLDGGRKSSTRRSFSFRIFFKAVLRPV